MISENGLGYRGGDLFCSAVFVFLSMVPGTALLIFGGGQSTVLPSQIIEFIFPFTIFPPEKLLIVTFANWVGPAVTFDDFYGIDVFIQQFSVLSFFFFFFILIGLPLYLIALNIDLLATRPKSSVILKPLVVLFLLREAQLLVLVASPESFASFASHNSKAHFPLTLMRAMAPEILIFVSCSLAVAVCMLMLMAYRSFFER